MNRVLISSLILASIASAKPPQAPPIRDERTPQAPPVATVKHLPYASFHAHCLAASGTLYVGVSADRPTGVYCVVASGTLTLADGVYDCSPGNAIVKRAEVPAAGNFRNPVFDPPHVCKSCGTRQTVVRNFNGDGTHSHQVRTAVLSGPTDPWCAGST